MKSSIRYCKRIFAGLCMAVLFASMAISAYAMNFDFDEVSKSIFIVMSCDVNGEPESQGSGFAIDNQHIITNAHVITNQNSIVIATYSEHGENHIGGFTSADLVAIDTSLDLAIIKVAQMKLQSLPAAEASSIKEGSDVYAIGAPEGLAYTLTKGTVSSKSRVSEGVTYVQTDAAINHGNSGGPLLNDDGQVIGVNTLKSATSENIGFAIRIDMVQVYLAQNGLAMAVGKNSEPDSNSESKPDPEVEIKPETEAKPSPTPDSDSGVKKESSSSSEGGMLIAVIIGLLALGGIVAVIIVLAVKSSPNKIKSDEPEIPVINRPNDFVSPAAVAVPEFKAPPMPSLNCYMSGKIAILSGNMSGAEVDVSAGETIVIGKDPSIANLILDGSYRLVSRHHCDVTYDAVSDGYYVTDRSSNGTYLSNGTRLEKGQRISVERGTTLKIPDGSCLIQLQ